MKLIFLFIFCVAINAKPIFAKDQTVQMNTDLTFLSGKYLGVKNGLRPADEGMATLNVKYNSNNASSQLALNYKKNDKITFDGSYFKYTSGIATFGLGLINRHWSFSDNTSLILSQNARPSKSIYLQLKDSFKYDWVPSKANWSFEVFNGFTEGSLNNTKSMLTGSRATLSPIEGLSFEFVLTSQWGGKGYDNGVSGLSASLFKDSNNASNSNINKMAGFGLSYLVPNNIIPLRIYGQAIGEDEAGQLPSCYAYLVGLEWSNDKNKYPISVGIEAVDTRVDKTEHGNCGPNTMYNNNTYDYTNYGVTMGAEIDTEGTSLGLFIQSQISQKISIEYTTKAVVINDDNWSSHRLASKRQAGLINSLGASWNKDNISFNGDVFYQGLSLDKAKIKRGYGVSLHSSIMF